MCDLCEIKSLPKKSVALVGNFHSTVGELYKARVVVMLCDSCNSFIRSLKIDGEGEDTRLFILSLLTGELRKYAGLNYIPELYRIPALKMFYSWDWEAKEIVVVLRSKRDSHASRIDLTAVNWHLVYKVLSYNNERSIAPIKGYVVSYSMTVAPNGRVLLSISITDFRLIHEDIFRKRDIMRNFKANGGFYEKGSYVVSIPEIESYFYFEKILGMFNNIDSLLVETPYWRVVFPPDSDEESRVRFYREKSI